MKKENTEGVETTGPEAVEAWVKEAQLSPDDLDAVVGGLQDKVTCGSTYCASTYSSTPTQPQA